MDGWMGWTDRIRLMGGLLLIERENGGGGGEVG